MVMKDHVRNKLHQALAAACFVDNDRNLEYHQVYSSNSYTDKVNESSKFSYPVIKLINDDRHS